MIYGYARVSTKNQKLDRQIENIKKVAPDAIVVTEKYTGTTQNRPEWQKLLKNLKEEDTLICDEISRFARSAEEGYEDYKALYDKGIHLVFCKQPHLNSDTYKSTLNTIPMTESEVDIILEAVNKYLMMLAEKQIQLAFQEAEHEVEALHKRVKEGMMIAKLNGKQIGRKTGSSVETLKSRAAKEIILQHSILFGGTLSDAEVMQLARVSRNAYYKYKRELREQEIELDEE